MNSLFTFIPGPCSLESTSQIVEIIQSFQDKTPYLRAGLFKLRTNAQSFQGLGLDGIKLVQDLLGTYSFKLVTEITDPRQIEALLPVTSVFQVGTRNMYNYELLKALNQTQRPVILKRAFSATIKEWLQATDYLRDLGEENILLCERGIRTFENAYRNTLDLNAVSYIKQNTNFKILVDPSHGTGNSAMVLPMARAAVMAGCDGLLVEVHPQPTEALSDADQGITIQAGVKLFQEVQDLLKLRSDFYA